ncbi:transcriptional regulator, AraC family [Amphibacillus marinus]|uniref:Transcriptional regulator, AraC family n=1 Tax=Amphibacillus marinus TaxID=872970 RepID=A0A1H8RF89_9BACI|nr:AraC family transcriptional regulator [Amphibacillus marinus]SEO65111.1 transcriptional regulator, AraC family [Amphibacillus marinus]
MTKQFKLYQAVLVELINDYVQNFKKETSVIPGLHFFRSQIPSEPIQTTYNPSLCLIVQGKKEVSLANETYIYDANSYLVASLHLPITGQIIEATRDKPYLALQMDFTTEQIITILKKMPTPPDRVKLTHRGLHVSQVNEALLAAATRLVQLLKTPKDISVLAPLISQEILYHVLQSDQGHRLIQFAITGTYARRIAESIQWLRMNFSEPIRVQDLADRAHMSVSSFHQHFKDATGLTPIQYQKQIRLQEARQLLLINTHAAAEVAFQVGYESPSQFNREYTRMFGQPPLRDIKQFQNKLVNN